MAETSKASPEHTNKKNPQKLRDENFRGTTLIDLFETNRPTHFIINADSRPGLLPVKGSPGRLGSELRLLLSSGGSQSLPSPSLSARNSVLFSVSAFQNQIIQPKAEFMKIP